MKTFDVSNKHVGTIDFDLTTACCLIAQIQLACRHRTREIVEAFARQLQEMVTMVAPENAIVLEMGWNPDFDIE
jgi:hypothetical protein